jgi:chromosome segregation ATPase
VAERTEALVTRDEFVKLLDAFGWAALQVGARTGQDPTPQKSALLAAWDAQAAEVEVLKSNSATDLATLGKVRGELVGAQAEVEALRAERDRWERHHESLTIRYHSCDVSRLAAEQEVAALREKVEEARFNSALDKDSIEELAADRGIWLDRAEEAESLLAEAVGALKAVVACYGEVTPEVDTQARSVLAKVRP